MVYKNTNQIKETRLNIDWYNTLLDIFSLSTFEDEHLQLITDECYGLYQFDFEDGSCITIDLCHGTENYYDDCVWHSKDGKHDVVFDCSYCIDTEMEFSVGENTYICNLTIEEEEEEESLCMK